VVQANGSKTDGRLRWHMVPPLNYRPALPPHEAALQFLDRQQDKGRTAVGAGGG
jgi:hypothetical protein